MKLIHFKIEDIIGVNYFYKGCHENNYDEVWLPERKIDWLSHNYDCGEDTYHINEYKVSKETFEDVLKQLKGE